MVLVVGVLVIVVVVDVIDEVDIGVIVFVGV